MRFERKYVQLTDAAKIRRIKCYGYGYMVAPSRKLGLAKHILELLPCQVGLSHAKFRAHVVVQLCHWPAGMEAHFPGQKY